MSIVKHDLPHAQHHSDFSDRFQVGPITQKDVIDFQSRLIDAEGTKLRSLTDYSNAIAKLKPAEGTLLLTYNVKIEDLTQEAISWWAKF